MEKKIENTIYNFLVFLDRSKIALILFSEICLGIFLSVLSFLIFLKIGKAVLEHNSLGFDYSVSAFILSFRNPLLTKIMIIISYFGQDMILLLATLFIIVLIIRKHREYALLFFLILGTGAAINLFVKDLVQRPRPDIAPLFAEPFYSFPSGHTMNSFVFYASVAYFIFHFTRNKPLCFAICIASLILIILIGISRIYLGVHYPTDVIAGFIGGSWWFVTALVIEKTFRMFKLFKNVKKDIISN